MTAVRVHSSGNGMKVFISLAIGTFLSSVFANGITMNPESLYINTSASSSASTSSSTGNFSSEASFTAHNGVHKVNGDTVEVKDGSLSVNGVSYGQVEKNSLVKYSVKRNKKVLTVDGAVRQPVR
jgi:hypothetical protein